MHVTVRWTWLEDESAPDWETTNCLFAFADPESDEIVYLGDCGASSVRDRCEAAELEHRCRQEGRAADGGRSRGVAGS